VRRDPAGAERVRAGRVVGLGAPLSVRIRLEPCERAALRRQILNQAAASPSDVTPEGATPAPANDTPQTQAWQEMLVQLEASGDDAPAVVLWPTALATPALRDALTLALAAVAQCPRGDAELAALADTLTTASTLLETLRALLAVDHGGLQAVDL
jgi:hypothetical protein